jgi:hypothetical protein
MRGNFQTKKEHRAKAAETITEFERAFERRSDSMVKCTHIPRTLNQYARTILAGAGGCLKLVSPLAFVLTTSFTSISSSKNPSQTLN